MSALPDSDFNILLIWDRIGDYHAARFLELERQHGRGSVFVADVGGADSLYKWKNPLANHSGYCSLSSKPVEEADLRNRLEIFRKLVLEKNIKVIGIAGYGRPEYRHMMHWCRVKGIRIILFAESWYPGRLDFLKGMYLRYLCDGFLVSGLRAKEHFQHRLGIPGDKIKLPYSVVDNVHFEKSNPGYAAKKILCLARFSPEKNLENLILAFSKSRISETGWTLELVGGGPLKMKLEESAPESVCFIEWVAYEDLPALYSSASFFVLPSSFEPWGLVVNEAMAAGLPVVVSEECGCAPDLVPDSRNKFPAGKVDEMAAVLRRLAGLDPAALRNLGEENRNRIAGFGCEQWAHSFLSLTRS